MKKLIALFLFWTLPAFAGDLQFVELSLSNVSTNGTNDTVNSAEIVNGYIDSIYIDIAATQTARVDIVSIAAAGLPAKTIFTHTNVTADAWFYPATPKHNVTGNVPLSNTNELCGISIMQQKIQLGAQYLQNLATNSVTAYILFKN